MAAEVGHCLLSFLRLQVLEHFNANDEVVGARKRTRDRAHMTVGPDGFRHIFDGVFGDIDAVSLNASISQGIDQKAECTTGVENTGTREIALYAVSDAAKKSGPVLFFMVIRQAASGREIVGIVKLGNIDG